MMKKKNISSLLLLESPNKHQLRSLSNRLAILLLGMADEYKFIKSRETACIICCEIMKSMISRRASPGFYEEIATSCEEPADKQYIFYCLKTLDGLCFVTEQVRTTISGQVSCKMRLVELVKSQDCFSELTACSKSEEIAFWDTFFRHHNYLLEKNTPLVSQMIQKKTKSTLNLIFQEFKKSENRDSKPLTTQDGLNKCGIRACSLVEVIRLMVCFDQPVSAINEKVTKLKEKYKLDRELAERVIRSSEEFVSVLMEPPRVPERNKFVLLKGVIKYLGLADGLALANCCREAHKLLRDEVVYSHLEFRDGFDQNSDNRMQLWSNLIPKVVASHPANIRPHVPPARPDQRKRQVADRTF
jgi:hypothetical protein